MKQKQEEVRLIMEKVNVAKSKITSILKRVRQVSHSLRPTPAGQSEKSTEEEAIDLVQRSFAEFRLLLNAKENELLQQIRTLTQSKLELLEQQSAELTDFLSRLQQLSQKAEAWTAEGDAGLLTEHKSSLKTEWERLGAARLHLSPRIDATIPVNCLATEVASGMLDSLGALARPLPFVPPPQPRQPPF